MVKRHDVQGDEVERTIRPQLGGDDAGAAALRTAAASYARLREELLEEREATRELLARTGHLDRTIAGLNAEMVVLAAREAELAQATATLRARNEQERAATLLESVRAMHHALFRGTTWEHVLQASLDVTEAERGYYVSDEHGGLRVRAAVDVPAQVGDTSSPYITAVVRRVLETGDAVHWPADAPLAGMAPRADEVFREGVAVPVAIRGGACGVIIALDRDGEFRDTEVANLLSVGTEAGVAVENARLRMDLQRAYMSTISMLANTVSAKDPYTQGHCEQVSHYARVAAEQLSLSTEERRVACYAALLHDVGKIGVSDGVLNKPDPLIAEERKLVEAHVRIGHDLLAGIPALRDVASAILYHHEWWDGTGYPEGRTGEDIPIASRIVAVVDAYCAMLDKRSYKDAMSAEDARAELLRCAGTQFAPNIVEVVVAAIAQADALSGAGHAGEAHEGCGIMPGMVAHV